MYVIGFNGVSRSNTLVVFQHSQPQENFPCKIFRLKGVMIYKKGVEKISIELLNKYFLHANGILETGFTTILL